MSSMDWGKTGFTLTLSLRWTRFCSGPIAEKQPLKCTPFATERRAINERSEFQSLVRVELVSN